MDLPEGEPVLRVVAMPAVLATHGGVRATQRVHTPQPSEPRRPDVPAPEPAGYPPKPDVRGEWDLVSAAVRDASDSRSPSSPSQDEVLGRAPRPRARRRALR